MSGTRWAIGALSVDSNCTPPLNRRSRSSDSTVASAPPAQDGVATSNLGPRLFAPALDPRVQELERGRFSQHAIETVCFDLRIRRVRAVTAQFARDTFRVYTIDRHRNRVEQDNPAREARRARERRLAV